MNNRSSIILSFLNDLIGNPFFLKLSKVIKSPDSHLHENEKLKVFIKLFLFSSFLASLISCSSSKEFSEYENVTGELIESGVASWYGPNFHGKKTANGERFDQNELTAAHRTLPFNSIVRVINSSNGNSVIVRINDRGPYAKNRIIDLSKKAAEKIDIIQNGTGNVKLILLNNYAKLPANLKIPHYTVQVGSYANKQDALKISSNIADSRIVKANINGKSVYRIFIGLFQDKSEAESLNQYLKNVGYNGFVKQVEN